MRHRFVFPGPAPQGEFGITYSSWPRDFIQRRDLLNSFCLFYDRVYLPYPHIFDFWDGAHLFTFADDGSGGVRVTTPRRGVESVTFPALEQLQETYAKWVEAYDPLFEAGFIKHLPAPSGLFGGYVGLSRLLDYIFGGLDEFEDDSPVLRMLKKLTIPDIISGKFDVALHLLTAEKPAPEVFVGTAGDYTTAPLAGLLARTVFSLVIPNLEKLSPDQVIDLRQKVREPREGFRDHLIELIDDVEHRLQGGSVTESIAALETIKHKVMPSFDEYQRKLLAQETGFWSEVAVRGAKFLQVDASPWTPKFYGAILELLFGNVVDASKLDRAELNNKSQAFQYMGALKEFSNKTFAS
jgi:hypothetical protein